MSGFEKALNTAFGSGGDVIIPELDFLQAPIIGNFYRKTL